MFDILLVLCFA